MSDHHDPLAIIDQLEAHYQASVRALRGALSDYLKTGRRPDPQLRAKGAFAYPELRLVHGGEKQPRLHRAFARLNAPGAYATTITKPALFKDYLAEQIGRAHV